MMKLDIKKNNIKTKNIKIMELDIKTIITKEFDKIKEKTIRFPKKY